MPEFYVSGVWYPLRHDPEAAGWGRRPEPPPPLRLDWNWLDYYCCFLIVFAVWYIALLFRGFLLDDEYSVVNVLALLLTRIMHMLVMKSSSSSPAPPSSGTALALLPTCPAPALDLPPVCYDERSRLDYHSVCCNWMLIRSDGHGGDYKSAKKCFDSLVRDAAWTCDQQEDDYKAAMKCFDSLIRDAARICFVWSYDAVPLTRESNDPPPT